MIKNRNSFSRAALFNLINDELTESRVHISYVSDKLFIERTLFNMAQYFPRFSHFTVISNKLAYDDKLRKCWSYSTRDRAIPNTYLRKMLFWLF